MSEAVPSSGSVRRVVTCPACGHENPEGAKFCMECASPLGAPATTREVRKTVTALFCDLVGSTTLGEQHDPEVLRPVLERYFTEMAAAVERHGGQVQKFIGDAVSAVFGLPTAHEDDALRAVRAGIEMQERLKMLNEASPIPLAARVGITTGEVLVPGDGKPLIGDAMNTASRLQTSASPGEVLIGEPTFRLVRDAVAAEEVEPLRLKGKAEPVPAYRVLQVASLSPMRTRRLDAPMIGRDRESVLLEQAYERVSSDRMCQLFTVLGTAGAGKSRLVEEFLASHSDGVIMRGRCLPYGEGITFYPVTEAMKEALGLVDFDEESKVRQAIFEAVKTEEHAEAITANLAKLLGAGEGGSPEETFWAIRRFFETRGRDQPLVVVFDDIHWGEETFLDLIEHVADWSRDASILLLCMARPDLLDVRATWGGGKTNATSISLAPLSESESGELIDYLLGSSELPEHVRTRITRVAEGNPLFVEEMLRMLVDDGMLVREGEGWLPAEGLGDVQVPPTISALLSARLDRLSDEERSVIECAAVAGKEFHRGALLELLPEASRAGMDVHLRSLVRKELISPERSMLPGEDAYRFRHLLIRDAAYDQIPKAERAELHERFANWLESVAGERIVEQEEIVGYHLERAYRYREELGLPEDEELRLRAAKTLSAVGMRAVDRGDVTATIRLLRSAADLSEGDPMQLLTLTRLGQALIDAVEFDEAGLVNERLADAAAALGDAVFQTRARMGSYQVLLFRHPEEWDPEVERELVVEAERVFREHGADGLMPYAAWWLADVEWGGGNMSAMLARASEALGLAMRQGDRRVASWALSYVMSALLSGATPLSEALEHVTGFLGTFADDRAITATALYGRAHVNAWLGRPDEAAADAAAGRAITEDLGNRFDASFFPLIEGFVAWFERGAAAAETMLTRSHLMRREAGDRLNAGVSGISLARVLLELGRDGEARQVVSDFRDNRVEPSAHIEGRSLDAVLAARRGELDEAMRLSEEAEALAAATDLLIVQADVALDKAEVLLLSGRPDDARAAAEVALARFERKDYAIGVKRARAFLGRLGASEA